MDNLFLRASTVLHSGGALHCEVGRKEKVVRRQPPRFPRGLLRHAQRPIIGGCSEQLTWGLVCPRQLGRIELGCLTTTILDDADPPCRRRRPDILKHSLCVQFR